MICVSIGYGFFVEFTLAEALQFIHKKVTLLTKDSDDLTNDVTKIKANIKFVVEVRFQGSV